MVASFYVPTRKAGLCSVNFVRTCAPHNVSVSLFCVCFFFRRIGLRNNLHSSTVLVRAIRDLGNNLQTFSVRSTAMLWIGKCVAYKSMRYCHK